MKQNELQEGHWYSNGAIGRFHKIRLMIDMGSDGIPKSYCTFAVFNPETGIMEDATSTKLKSFAAWAKLEVQPAWKGLGADPDRVWVRWPVVVDRKNCMVSSTEPIGYSNDTFQTTWLNKLVHNLGRR